MKFRSRYGHFLRANGGLPPWRNSITHDIPYRSVTQDWILWNVDVLQVKEEKPLPDPDVWQPDWRPIVSRSDSSESDLFASSNPSPNMSPSMSPGHQVYK